MNIATSDLETFLKVYEIGTFSKASLKLGLSQSALSQKIARLEELLQVTLFIRHPRKLTLTSSGEELLIYAKETLQREESFLSGFNQYQKELSGVMRIAGFSSIMRSLVIPKFRNLIIENPNIRVEFKTFEMNELEDVLRNNSADIILTDYETNITRTVQEKIGFEEYVIINAKKNKNPSNTFIDHSKDDNATESYFSFLGLEKNYKRLFFGDVYSIIDGVSMGLGQAVMSKHLVESDKRFNLVEHKKRYKRPICMTYLKQNYYSPVHIKASELLRTIQK